MEQKNDEKKNLSLIVAEEIVKNVDYIAASDETLYELKDKYSETKKCFSSKDCSLDSEEMIVHSLISECALILNNLPIVT
jgi:hypothetical protein